jgi:iron complex transport system permease protein
VGNAFIFALISSLVILGLVARSRATPETMILAGVAMMYLFSAGTTLLQYFGDPEEVTAVVFWIVGDLGKANWDKLSLLAIVSACCIPLLLSKSWDLNAMGAGDETAESLGVNVKRSRMFIMVVASLLVASIVSFTGTIGFIGLVAPHMVRMVIGGDNRFILPASALAGGLCCVQLCKHADSQKRMYGACSIRSIGHRGPKWFGQIHFDQMYRQDLKTPEGKHTSGWKGHKRDG